MPLPIAPRKFSPVKTPVPPVSYAVVVATDGSGDFLTIQAAINALMAAGAKGEIKLREGTYAFTPTAPMLANIRIEGENEDATFIVLGGNLILGTGVELEHLTVSGAFDLTMGTDTEITDAIVKSRVIIPGTAARPKINRSTFDGVNVRQIDILSGASGVIIAQSTFRSYTSDGVRIAADECILSNCDFDGGGVAPRNIDIIAGGDRNILVGLRMTGATAQDLRIAGENNLLYASRNATVLEIAPAVNNRYSQLPGLSQSTLLIAGNSLVAEAERFQFYADQFDNPVNSDWAINSLAPASADSINAGLTVRRFDDTVEEGVGMIFRTIPLWGQIRLNLVFRAQTAPGAPTISQPKLYWRSISAAGVVSAWSSMNLAVLNVPASTAWVSVGQYITSGQLGVPDDDPIVLQFELTRVGNDGNDLLVGDLVILSADIEVF